MQNPQKIKIAIAAVFILFIAGGIFAWQYFGAPESEVVVPPEGQPGTETGRVAKDGCIITGCSGDICSDERVITTCEYRPEYACYKSAVCERQSNGTCDWTQTNELTQCLQDKRAKSRFIR